LLFFAGTGAFLGSHDRGGFLFRQRYTAITHKTNKFKIKLYKTFTFKHAYPNQPTNELFFLCIDWYFFVCCTCSTRTNRRKFRPRRGPTFVAPCDNRFFKFLEKTQRWRVVQTLGPSKIFKMPQNSMHQRHKTRILRVYRLTKVQLDDLQLHTVLTVYFATE